MTTFRFNEGDRVQASLPPSWDRRVGTVLKAADIHDSLFHIVATTPWTEHMYAVQFDGEEGFEVVEDSSLEIESQEKPAE